MKTYGQIAIVIAALAAASMTPAYAAAGGGSQPEREDDTKANPAKVPLDTDYEKAEYEIKNEQYDEAAVLLQRVVNQYPADADAWNLLGFATRKQGKNEEALGYYKKALAIDANHRGANEYLGELYLQMKDLKKAEEQLEILKGICGSNCEEVEDLKADIAKYKAANKPK